jgi:LPXTG-motif cell wall-anchored protein
MRSWDTRVRSPIPTLTGRTECQPGRGRGDDHLSARGFEATGRRDVANRSGVSVHTLMRHCGSFDATTTLPTVTHTYSAPFAGTIGLRVTTDAAEPHSATAVAEVQILVPTVVAYTGQREGSVGGQIHLKAVLTDRDGAPVSGAQIAFILGAQSCTGTTNHAGQAACDIVLHQEPGNYKITADAGPGAPYFRSGTSVEFILAGTGATPTGPPSATNEPPAPSGTAPATAPTEPDLPVTGAALGGLLLVGAALLAAGTLLLVVARRRRDRQWPVGLP